MNIRQTYPTLDSDFYSILDPVSYQTINVVVWNTSLAKELNLADIESHPIVRDLLTGNSQQATYFAQAYAGHQFGHFTMLGDGRAMMVAELDIDGTLQDLQLKGSGPTPYSRRGDGKATLRSMLREYLISEAMHALGIRTTRSLAVFQTGENVVRETIHQGAMLLRVASSHIRVGTFEFARALDDSNKLQQLADYTIDRHYPLLNKQEDKYLKLFETVVNRQADLIARWQSLGFVHGVMNTDNMTLSGETIDYGPCAFLDRYDPTISFSSIDRDGRYAYFRQPYIGSWNLSKLAMSLLPLVDSDVDRGVQRLNDILGSYQTHYEQSYLMYMGQKLGILQPKMEDRELIQEWLSLLQTYQADFTNSFVHLTRGEYDKLPFSMIEWTLWKEKWQMRILAQGDLSDAQTLMKQSNPVLIPRNHLVKQAVDNADFKDDRVLFDTLLALYEDPYNYDKPIDELYRSPSLDGKRFVSYCGT